jgi:hypothetical protein
MSASISGQGPALVPRSRYVHLRRWLAFAVAAGIALTVALVIVAATTGDSSPTARSSSPASSRAITPPPDAALCGVHYDGRGLVGRPCRSNAQRPH